MVLQRLALRNDDESILPIEELLMNVWRLLVWESVEENVDGTTEGSADDDSVDDEVRDMCGVGNGKGALVSS